MQEPANGLLARFWDETRLRAGRGQSTRSAAETPPAPDPLREALACALVTGYGQRPGVIVTKGRNLLRARTSPSAGGLYPFEVLVTMSGPGARSTYQYDVEGGSLRPLLHGVSTAGGRAVPQAAAAIVLVARPWLSMEKYGLRGYIYTCLDVAHAAASITMGALWAGLQPALRLRFARRAVARELGLDGLCREPQAVIALAGGPDGEGRAEPAPGGVEGCGPCWREEAGAALPAPGGEELASWRVLEPVRAYEASAPPPAPGQATSLASPEGGRPDGGPSVRLAAAAAPPSILRDFGPVSQLRQSAKGFLASALTLGQLAEVFGQAGAALPVDCAGPGKAGVGVRLLVANIEGLAPGVYTYVPEAHALQPLSRQPGEPGADDDDVVQACMGQPGVRHTALLVVLHTPLRPLIARRGPFGLAEIHFHAAHVAQKLYLGAARAGVGITCIGGFDEVRLSTLARLTSPEEVVYVLAAGVADDSAVKLDRAAVAYSHGVTGPNGGGSA
jgi:SagB-type dehydrogenase family enzyme